MRAKKLKVDVAVPMVHKPMSGDDYPGDYPMESKAGGYGYGVRQHQDVVPSMGQGPQGNCASMVPSGDTPPVAPPAVGHGKGFKGW